MCSKKRTECMFICMFVGESVHLWDFVCAVCLGVLIRRGLIKSVLEKEEQTGVIEKHKGTQSD